MLAVISISPWESSIAFVLFTIVVGKGQLERLTLGFPYHNSPHSTGQETNVRILTAAEYVYSNYTFQN